MVTFEDELIGPYETFHVIFWSVVQFPTHIENSATWVVGLTSWNSKFGSHNVQITQLN